MSFEEFQRESARREAAEAEAQRQRENADMDAEDKYERKHRRKSWRRDFWGRRKKGDTPFWRLTAGTWAQVVLTALYFALFSVVIHNGVNRELEGFLSFGAFFAAIIAAVITWRYMGVRARDAMRWVVRLSPVALLAFFLLKPSSTPKRGEADNAAQASASTTAQTATATPTLPTPERAMPTSPTPDAGPTTAAPPGGLTFADIERIAYEYERNDTLLRAASETPHDDGALAKAHASRAALRAQEPALTVYAQSATDELIARSPGSRAAVFALRYAPNTPQVVEALQARFTTQHGADEVMAFRSLVHLANGGGKPTVSGDSEVRTIYRAWLHGKVSSTKPKELKQACETLAVYGSTFDEPAPAPLGSLARYALADVAPRCRAAGPVLLRRLLEHAKEIHKAPAGPEHIPAFAETFRALQNTGVSNYGGLVRFLDDVNTQFSRPGPTAQETLFGFNRPGDVLDKMFDIEARAKIGVTRFVLNHPTGMVGLEKPIVKMGKCTAKQLGMTPKQLAARPPDRECVLSVKGAVRGPE